MSEPSLIIYDGDCVFCDNYVKFYRLKEAAGPVELIDARSSDARVAALWKSGYDLNEGMVFVHRGQTYYGADAVNVLAMLSSSSTMLNRLNAAVFRSKTVANLLYPFLKFGRRVTLLVRGRKLLTDLRG